MLALVFSIDDIESLIGPANFAFVVKDAYHPALDVNLKFQLTQDFPKFPCTITPNFNFHKANVNALCNALSSIDWSVVSRGSSVDVALDLFYNQLYNTFECHVPRYVSARDSSRFPIWFTHEIKRNRYGLHTKLKEILN
ncbi:hypothetical protein QE152_g10865 [Popillia japonica]|uniref:Uncharacterized protein n=1 Tax=Popillia japonica TaxID=7064 RepID=A0AAW1LTX9_POPJA